MSTELLTWQFEGLDIDYFEHLDGDGRAMAESFVDMIRTRYADRLPFDCCYEWCAGPGFIGFALLATKICNRLVLADINPEAVNLVQSTISKNQLEDVAKVYLSDNLDSVPTHEKFDLVVSNPPNYYCINPLHSSYSFFKGDLRPNDPEWSIHKGFYSNIRKFLKEDAVLCIEEVDPYATKCFMPNAGEGKALWGPEPFDIRPRQPIIDFKEMIESGGLELIETVVLPHESVPIHVLISHVSKEFDSNNIILRSNLVFLEQVGELDGGSFRLFALEDGKTSGYVDLPDEQLWLISMIELLVKARKSGLSQQELSSRLNITLDEANSAQTMLRNMKWAL